MRIDVLVLDGVFDLGLSAVLDTLQTANELIELCLNRRAVAVLSVLNNEDHKERDDRRPSVDDKLPSVGIMEYRTCDSPHDDNECC